MDIVASFLITNILWVLILSVTSVLVWETIALLRRGGRLDPTQTKLSLVAAVAYLFGKVIGTKLSVFAAYVWVWNNYALFDLGPDKWWAWIALFVAGDFTYYWIHRTEHTTRLLWASHSIHHSPTAYNFTTAVRMPWMEMFYKPFLIMWAPLLGFHPSMYAVVGGFALIAGQFQHSEQIGHLGWAEKVFVTPHNHRVHHASNPEYIDKNFGAGFIIWDRLFDTFAAYDPEVDITYGILHDYGTGGIADVLFGGFRELASDLRTRTITPRQLLTMN